MEHSAMTAEEFLSLTHEIASSSGTKARAGKVCQELGPPELTVFVPSTNSQMMNYTCLCLRFGFSRNHTLTMSNFKWKGIMLTNTTHT